VNKKAEILRQTLGPEFRVSELHDKTDTVVFQAMAPINEEQVRLAIMADETPYIYIQLFLADDAVTPAVKPRLLSYLNELNLKYGPVKFCVNDEGTIVAALTYIADDEHFEAELCMAVVGHVVQALELEAPALLKLAASYNR